jgi:hypothetical protein
MAGGAARVVERLIEDADVHEQLAAGVDRHAGVPGSPP